MLIMKKLLINLQQTARRLLSPDKGEIGSRVEILLRDEVSIVTFRNELQDLPYEEISFQTRTDYLYKVSKEKLFCLKCYNLSHTKENKHVAKLLFALFEGEYDLKMDEWQARAVYNMLDFTSKIFIQERNRSIKKLFV